MRALTQRCSVISICVLACACSPAALSGATPDSGDDGGDAGPGDAGLPCDNPLAAADPGCGTVSWSKSPIGTTPRNHHLSDLTATDAGVFLYVVGGGGSSPTLPNVDRALLNADGSLSPFTSDSPLPMAIAGMAGGIVGDLFVVAGGQGPSGANLARSYFTTIHPDGSLSAWQRGEDVGKQRMHPAAFVRGDTIYVMGGFNDPNVWDDIVKANVYPNHTLSEWTPAGKLPGPRSHMSVSAAGDFVYLAGGLNQSAFTLPPDLDEVWRGRVTQSGDVAEWTAMTPLPVGLATHGSFIYGGYLYVAGGLSAAGHEKRVWRAPFAADRSLGAWEEATPLPTPRAHVHNLPVSGTHVYSIAGALDFNLDSTGDIRIGTFQ